MLALPSEITHSQARACSANLRASLATSGADAAADVDGYGQAVVLDASQLVKFDSSALAVMLQCRRAALAAGGSFGVHNLTPRLQQLANMYGVDSLLTPT